jgi:PIN domain nuclease of toxin-antitoxin system
MAGYLLDSNAFVWIKTDPEQIDPETLAKLTDASNRVLVSIAALWELAIKSATGKLGAFGRVVGGDAAAVREALRESRLEILAIDIHHVLGATRLPLHHRDPFDRMMIAQAQKENLVVVTRDAMFARYAVHVLHI